MGKMMKKVISTILVAAIILCSAPLSGLVGLELPAWLDFSIKSKALSSLDNSINNGMNMALGLEWDKDSYSAGETAYLNIYMRVAEGYEFSTGSLLVGLNSSVIDSTQNDKDVVISNSSSSDLWQSFWKNPEEETIGCTWLTSTTLVEKVQEANLLEENKIYNQYFKVSLIRNTNGSHENACTTKYGLPSEEINALNEPILTLGFIVNSNVTVGTSLNAAITTGSISCTPAQTSLKYLIEPGNDITTAVFDAATTDVTYAVTSVDNKFDIINTDNGSTEESDVCFAECLEDMAMISESHYEGNLGDSRVFNLNKQGLPGNWNTYCGYGNVAIDGTELHNGFEVWIARWNYGDNISWASATFDIGGQYQLLSGKTHLIQSYNTSNFDTTVYFYNGVELLNSYRITPNDYQHEILIDVTGVNELTVLVKDNIETAGGTSIGLYDMFLTSSENIQEYEGNYYKLCNEGYTWEEAKAICEDLGGHLVTITSQEEQDFIDSLIGNSIRGCWLGGYKNENNIWTWVTNEIWHYVNWGDDEPNNYLNRGEKYLLLEDGKWNDQLGDGDPTGISLSEVVFICEWEGEVSKEKYPSGYDPDFDRYCFVNLKETIDVDIYKKAFGTQKGWLLYRLHEDGDIHGHCYGMTSTTAALLKYPSAINYFESCYTEDYFTSNLMGVFPEYENKLFNVDARTYIKYGYVYQFDSDVQKAEKKSQDDIVGLYNAVNRYVNGTGDPVIINVYHTDILGRKDGHSVFAIGTMEEDGKKYILINDSNIPYKVQKMLVDTDSNSWDYTAYYIDDSNNTQTMYNYSSSNGVFTYSFPADVIYNVGLLLNSNSSEFLSTDRNLVSATNNISTDNTLEEILPATGGNTDSTSNKLYWADEDAEEIQITALEDNSTVTVCDNNSSASVVMNTSESANFVVDDYNDSSVVVDCPDRENVDITFSTSNCSGDEVEIIVSATSTADQVTATLTDNGVEISGVTDGDVSLVKFDEILESATITDTENTVEFVTELPHAGHNFVDGVCADCGQRTIRLEEMSSQIRFDTNEDGSYAGTFDVRTRAKILDEDFNALIGSTNAEAQENIDSIGFVYTLNGENFSAESAQAVAQGKTVAGYVNAPVKSIQDCDGYYMFTCLVTDIPETDTNYTLTAYAYICVNGKWYFVTVPTNADFNSLYSQYYPLACEKYGW